MEMKVNGNNYASTASQLSWGRIAYFSISAATMVSLVATYGVDAVKCKFLLAGTAICLVIVGVAMANLISRGRVLSDSSVLGRKTQLLLRCVSLALPLPALVFVIASQIAIVLYDGTDLAEFRIESINKMELMLFGKSMVPAQVDTLCRSRPFANRNLAVGARGKLAAGEAAFAQHQLTKARDLYFEASDQLESCKSTYWLKARANDDLGVYYSRRSLFNELTPKFFGKAISCLTGQSRYIDPDSAEIAAIYLHQGQYYLGEGNYSYCEMSFREALRIYEGNAEGNREALSQTLLGLAEIKNTRGGSNDKASLYVRAAIWQAQSLNSDHPDLCGLARTLICLIPLYQHGYTAGSEDLLDHLRCGTSTTPAAPGDHEHSLWGEKMCPQAADLDEQLHKLVQQALDSQTVGAEELLRLADVVRDFDCQSDAQTKLVERALSMAILEKNRTGEDSLILADALCRHAPDCECGAEDYARALDIYERRLGARDLTVVDKLKDAAQFFLPDQQPGSEHGQNWQQCQYYSDRSVEAAERAVDPRFPDYSALINCIADAADCSQYESAKDYERVEHLMEKYERYSEKLHGSQSVEFAETLTFLAVKYDMQHHFGKAEPRYTRALKIFKLDALKHNHKFEYQIALGHYDAHKAFWRHQAKLPDWNPSLAESYRVWP